MPKDFKELTMEDLVANPAAYGVPTYEEFAKAPHRWRKAADDIFKTVDVGSTTGLKNLVVRQTYEVAGYRCKTLEEAERVAVQEGWNLKAMDMRPQVIPLGGGKCNIHVVFAPTKGTKEGIIDDAIESSLLHKG